MTMNEPKPNIHLVVEVANQIEIDMNNGDYAAIQDLFQFLDDPEKRLKAYLLDEMQYVC
jgi:hypothetical protein|tara:strand:- start:61 stop:237 length:177 start_codon:yes stop_codon:yes gene_type:complete